MHASPLDDALRHLTAEFSLTDDEFRRAFPGDQVRDGLLAHGYILRSRSNQRLAVSDKGRARLADVDKPDADE